MVLLLAVLCSVAWSASEQIRLLLTHRLAWNHVQVPLIGIVTIIITVVVAALFWRLMHRESKYGMLLSTLLLGIALAHLFSKEQSVYVNGASEIATVLSTHPAKTNLIVIHPDFPNEEYAPQLAYYTGGWTLDWIPGKFASAITWDSAATRGFTTDSACQFVVVTRFEDRFYHPPASEVALWDKLTGKLRLSFSHEQLFRSYVIFY